VTGELQDDLQPEACHRYEQPSRKNIIENLTKGIDTAGTSAGDPGSLMEKASRFGTDVKKMEMDLRSMETPEVPFLLLLTSASGANNNSQRPCSGGDFVSFA
jgi:hypothetical protein